MLSKDPDRSASITSVCLSPIEAASLRTGATFTICARVPMMKMQGRMAYDLLYVRAVICSEIRPIRKMMTDALNTSRLIFVNLPIVK